MVQGGLTSKMHINVFFTNLNYRSNIMYKFIPSVIELENRVVFDIGAVT